MEDYSKYTKEELESLIHDLINEYNGYKEVISQAYEGMKDTSVKYTKIIEELEHR